MGDTRLVENLTPLGPEIAEPNIVGIPKVL